MENELLIKGILIRWLHSTTTSGEKINFSNAAKTVNDIGIQVEVTPEFKKLVKELIAEYNAPDVSFKTLLEKYPFVKIVPKGEAEEVTQKVVEKSEDELKEIIREQFLKVVKKRSDMFGMTAWNQVKQTLLEAYPELNDKKAKINRLAGEVMEELEQNRPEFNEEEVEQQEDLFEEEVEIKEKPKKEKKEKKEKPMKEKKEKKEQEVSMKFELAKQISKVAVMPEDFAKTNLPYYAALSYYAADRYTPVNDPFLTDFFMNFYNISPIFKNVFVKLSPNERLAFIKEVFDNKSLKEIYSNLIEQQELFNKPISVYIVNFQKENSKKKCENLLQNVKDELYYNSMHYVASLDFTESEFQDKEKLQKSILEQLVSLLQRRLIKINEDDTTTKCIINEDESDEVYKYVKDFVGVLLEDVNSKQELEDKFKAAQKAAIKELLNGEFSVYYDEDDEEAQYEIQRLYNYSFPELLEGLQYKYVADDNLKGKPAIMHYVYYSVGAQAQTDLSFLSEYFSNEQNRKRLLVILERITEMIRPSEKSELGLGDAKKERDAIQGLKKKGEIDELDVKFLETFINYYGSLKSLPTSSKNRTLDLNYLSQYPRDIQSSIYKTLMASSNKVAMKLKKEKSSKKEQTDIITKLQVELNKELKNIQRITDLINDLNIADEVKAKLLYGVKNNEFDNIYILLKNSEVKIKTLLNPLQYRGIRRSYRLQKLHSQQDELQKIIGTLPKVSAPLKECIMLHYLAPWKNISYEKADNIEFHNVPHTENRAPLFNAIKNFIYFIASPSGLAREEMSPEQQKFFSHYELPLTLAEGAGKSWNKAPIYIPTSYFWKVYCSSPLDYSGNKLSLTYPVKDENGNMSTSTVTFTIGILYPGKGKDNFVTNVFTEQDFKNEKAWFEEHMAVTSNFYNFCRLNLNVSKQVREKTRERGLVIIKDTLTKLYKAARPDLRESEISYNTRKLEEVIYDKETDITVDKYLNIIETVVYFLSTDSPIASNINYYKNLFLNTPTQAYKDIIYTDILTYVPEIYLIDSNVRKQFLQDLHFYLENRTYSECRKVYNAVNVGKSKASISEFHESSIIDIATTNTKKLFTNVDAKNLRNICINRDSVTSPDVVITVNNLLYCFSNEDVQNIINDKESLTIPDEVKTELKKSFSKEFSDYATRLTDIKTTINSLVKDDFLTLVDDFDIKFIAPSTKARVQFKNALSLSKKENQKYKEPFEELIENINVYVEPSLTEEEKDLVLQHLLEQINVEYFKQIENPIIKALEKDPSLSAKVYSIKQKISSAKDDESATKIKLTEQMKSLLAPVISSIQNTTELDVSEAVLDYIGGYIASKHEAIHVPKKVQQKTDKCFSCQSIVENARWRTFYSTQEALFCSKTCFERLDEKVTTDNTQAVKESLVRSLLWPYIPARFSVQGETIRKDNDIISIFEEDGSKIEDVKNIDVGGLEQSSSEENYDYDTIYGLILKKPTFTLSSTILEQRKTTLKLLADKFNIKYDDKTSLQDIYEKLRQISEFNKMYEVIANSYITDTDNSLDKLVNEFMDTQSDDSVYALAKRFRINIGTISAPRSKSEIISDLEKHKKISASIKRVSNKDKLLKYGIMTPQGIPSYNIEVGATKKNMMDEFAINKAKTWFEKAETIDFTKDLFEPYMLTNNLSFDKELIEKYYILTNSFKILDSYGEALNTMKNTNEENLLAETNNNFINKIVKEYTTTGRLLIEDGKKKIVKFDTEEEAREFIMPRVKASPIDIQTIINSIGASTIKRGLKEQLETILKKYKNREEMLEEIANYKKMKEDGRISREELEELQYLEYVVENLGVSHAKLLELEAKEGKLLSVNDLEMASKRFIKDPASKTFSSYIFSDQFDRKISSIMFIQDTLRKLSNTFIKKVCDLQANKELADFVPVVGSRGRDLTRKIKETSEEFIELEAKIRKLEYKGKTEKAEKKMKKLMVLKEKLERLEKKGKKVEKSEKKEEIKPIEKAKRVSKREQMTKEQQVAVEVKKEIEPLAVKLVIKSEKALKSMFGDLYNKPFKPVPENTEVKIIDYGMFSSVFISLFGKIAKKDAKNEVRAIIYSSPKKSGEKYILKLLYNGMLVDALRTAFEVYKPEVESETKTTGELVDEDVDNLIDELTEEITSDNVVEDDIDEAIADLKERRKIISEGREDEQEVFVGAEEEGEEEGEEVDYDDLFDEEEVEVSEEEYDESQL
jgi:hypothetical protein